MRSRNNHAGIKHTVVVPLSKWLGSLGTVISGVVKGEMKRCESRPKNVRMMYLKINEMVSTMGSLIKRIIRIGRRRICSSRGGSS